MSCLYPDADVCYNCIWVKEECGEIRSNRFIDLSIACFPVFYPFQLFFAVFRYSNLIAIILTCTHCKCAWYNYQTSEIPVSKTDNHASNSMSKRLQEYTAFITHTVFDALYTTAKYINFDEYHRSSLQVFSYFSAFSSKRLFIWKDEIIKLLLFFDIMFALAMCMFTSRFFECRV